jgi:hypothetical protein
VYLVVNTFFISAFLGVLPSISSNFMITELTTVVIVIFLILCFASIFIVLLAVSPFLKSGTKNGAEASIFFYESVHGCDKDYYCKKLIDIEEESLQKDVGNQLYCLAEALSGKYKKLMWAGRLIILEFILLIPIVVLLCIHLKK